MLTKKTVELIMEFMNPAFSLTEKNLTKFVTKFRKSEKDNLMSDNYTYSAVNDYFIEDATSNFDKTVTFSHSTYSLIETAYLDKNLVVAYKVNFLISLFHEYTHEKDFDVADFAVENGIRLDPYSRIVSLDCKNMAKTYDSLASMMEINARYNSIKTIVDLIQSDPYHNIIPDAKEIYPFILLEIYNLLYGINNVTEEVVFQADAFNADRMIKKIEENYGEFKEQERVKFKEIFESKMHGLFENEYKFVMSKIAKDYRPSKQALHYLAPLYSDRVKNLINKPLSKDLKVLTTDCLNKVKNAACDFSYTGEDIAEFIRSKYKISFNEASYQGFVNDRRAHNEFGQFVRSKYMLDNKSENLFSI